MKALRVVQAYSEPHLAGYRVVGCVSHTNHKWQDWLLEPVTVRKVRALGRRRRRDGRLRKRRELARA